MSSGLGSPTYMATARPSCFRPISGRWRPTSTTLSRKLWRSWPPGARCAFSASSRISRTRRGVHRSFERRKQLAEIAARRNLLIIEDDPYGRLRYRGEHLPPIKSFDENGRVIYLSTFSKTVAPGFRTGWIVASGPMRDNW